jgi:hypothetical protein
MCRGRFRAEIDDSIDYFGSVCYNFFAQRHHILNLKHCFCAFVSVYASEPLQTPENKELNLIYVVRH